MAATAKFLFDLDFGNAEPKPTVPVAEHAAKLAEAEVTGTRIWCTCRPKIKIWV